ncbi:MAG: hypothetical protein EBU90_00920 [Proteobacteria bacterium]|nr:hypothetical protein [Pseudomonadota bacterium]NBP12995.1 hypothetical protein [bacterium]
MPKKKQHKKVTVTFDERHLPVIARALEVFMRMRSGQIDMALDECYADKQTKMLNDRSYDHFNDNQNIETMIRRVYFKELSNNAAWGVGQYGFGGEEAYMIWKTLRQYMAYERNGGYAGTGRDFDTTWGKYSEVPNPVVQGFSTRKFFKAPKSLQEKLEYLYEQKEYQEMWKIIDKKWKSLPRGDKYEIGYQLPDDPSEWYKNIGVWVTAPRKKEEGW